VHEAKGIKARGAKNGRKEKKCLLLSTEKGRASPSIPVKRNKTYTTKRRPQKGWEKIKRKGRLCKPERYPRGRARRSKGKDSSKERRLLALGKYENCYWEKCFKCRRCDVRGGQRPGLRGGELRGGLETKKIVAKKGGNWPAHKGGHYRHARRDEEGGKKNRAFREGREGVGNEGKGEPKK